jgi:DNA-binding response OmpR family regulator
VKQVKILIIDDEPTICEGCRLVLSEKGYLVETSQKGREGLDLLLEGTYDLALLDLKLPDMNGMEILQIVGNDKPGVSPMMN